ncbi:MAG: hypothetical protein K2F89_06090 [Treponemataceae bacterium]|nr:hypothetical protein [Treponemataceae bacterium]
MGSGTSGRMGQGIACLEFSIEKIFEDELVELQADMVDICNEYSCNTADKIFIYVAYEDLLFAMHFYIINNKILMPGELNNAGLKIEFDVSDECQEQVLNVLDEDVKKIKVVCDKYNQPMPTEMRLTYEPKTKKFNAEYKYEAQFTDDMGLSDIVNAWFEEEKAKLEGASA